MGRRYRRKEPLAEFFEFIEMAGAVLIKYPWVGMITAIICMVIVELIPWGVKSLDNELIRQAITNSNLIFPLQLFFSVIALLVLLIGLYGLWINRYDE